MRARELTYRSKQTKEGGEVGCGDGPLLIAEEEEMFSGPSEQGCDYAVRGMRWP
jgi:hypothetical protein